MISNFISNELAQIKKLSGKVLTIGETVSKILSNFEGDATDIKYLAMSQKV